MTDLLADQTPTRGQIDVAVELVQMHPKSSRREKCAWCARALPCPDRRRCDRILAREASRAI
jgi:hypothetical protein